MFDIGWTEMLIVAIITVLFVGPRELPGMLRTFGAVVKNLKSMAGEFQSQFSQALRQSELDELKKTINEPVKIDEPQKKQSPQEIEAEIAKNYAESKGIKKSSGKNAVPGFTTTEPKDTNAKPSAIYSEK